MSKVIQVNLTGKFLSIDDTPMSAMNAAGETEELVDIHQWLGKSIGNLETNDRSRTMFLARKVFKNKVFSLEKHDFEYFKSRVKEVRMNDVMGEQVDIKIAESEEKVKEKK